MGKYTMGKYTMGKYKNNMMVKLKVLDVHRLCVQHSSYFGNILLVWGIPCCGHCTTAPDRFTSLQQPLQQPQSPVLLAPLKGIKHMRHVQLADGPGKEVRNFTCRNLSALPSAAWRDTAGRDASRAASPAFLTRASCPGLSASRAASPAFWTRASCPGLGAAAATASMALVSLLLRWPWTHNLKVHTLGYVSTLLYEISH